LETFFPVEGGGSASKPSVQEGEEMEESTP